MPDEVVLMFRQGNVLCNDFEYFLVEVCCDVKHPRQTVLQFVMDELFGVVPPHFSQDLGEERAFEVHRDLAEIFERKVVGITCRLIDAHFAADARSDPGLDMIDHEGDDDEVRDILDNHADGFEKIFEPVCLVFDELLCPGDDFVLLLQRQFVQHIGHGDPGPGEGFVQVAHCGLSLRFIACQAGFYAFLPEVYEKNGD
jgi:hypothetical protein